MAVNVLCVIQARYNSKRLPGKMLLKVGGETLIERGYRLACEAFGRKCVIVAIPYKDRGSPLDDELDRIDVKHIVAIGAEDDLLERFYATGMLHGADARTVLHRWTPDDWRKDPEMCRRVANGEKGIPVEIGGEALTFARLKELHRTTTDPYFREHIGFLINRHPVKPPEDGLPWSIDTEQDLIAANESLYAESKS